MLRKVLLILLATASFLPACVAATGGKAVKIGFISLKKVSEESLKSKAFKEEMRKLLEEKTKALDAVRKEIADLQTARALSGPEQAKKEEQKIAQKILELNNLNKEHSRELQKKQLLFEKEILQDIGEAVKEVAEDEGYTWVLFDEVLVYKDESADLTFQTLVKMNKKYTGQSPPAEAPTGSGQPETKPEK